MTPIRIYRVMTVFSDKLLNYHLSLTDYLAFLPLVSFGLHCGQWRAKHTTLLVITVRKRTLPQFPLSLPWGVALLWPPKAPRVLPAILIKFKKLQPWTLSLGHWPMRKISINQLQTSMRRGGRVRTEGSFWESLSLFVPLSSEEQLPLNKGTEYSPYPAFPL